MRRVLGISLFLVLVVANVTLLASSGGVPVLKEEKSPQGQASSGSKPQLKPESKPSTEPSKPALSEKEIEELKKKNALIAKKKEVLNNTEWDIEMLPLSGKGKSLKDVVVFAENKVSLKGLAEKGFSSTNYTLSIRDDGKLIWETMQSKGDEIVFFRGEISPDLESMNGIVSFQKVEGPEDYSFKSTAKRRTSLK